MLKDIDNIKVPIKLGKNDWYLRFNLNAQMCIECAMEMEFDEIIKKDSWTADETLQYLRALLIDNFYDENKEYINSKRFDLCRPTLSELGRVLNNVDLEDLNYQILGAISAAMPKTVECDENFTPAV